MFREIEFFFIRHFLYVSDFLFKDCITAFPFAFISPHVERGEQPAAAEIHCILDTAPLIFHRGVRARVITIIAIGDLLSVDAMNISFKDEERTEHGGLLDYPFRSFRSVEICDYKLMPYTRSTGETDAIYT